MKFIKRLIDKYLLKRTRVELNRGVILYPNYDGYSDHDTHISVSKFKYDGITLVGLKIEKELYDTLYDLNLTASVRFLIIRKHHTIKTYAVFDSIDDALMFKLSYI